MNHAEVAGLLGYVAATDNRQPSQAAVLAWSNALDDRLTLTQAKHAVDVHRAESTDYLMPAHINTIVRRIRRERISRAGTPPIPGGLIYAMERAWSRAWCEAVGDGVDDPVATANASVGYKPPPELPRDITGTVTELERKWTA